MLILPYPNSPQNGQTGDASVLLANQTAIAQAIQNFDASQVAAGTLSAAAFNASINPNTILRETTANFMYSGGVVAGVSGFNITISGGTFYINGIRLTFIGVGSATVTASRDTYIDVDYNGNVYYQSVTNGASAPALTANSMRIALVISGASAVSSIQQGGFDNIGTIIANRGAITAAQAPNLWYEELARVTLVSNGTTMSIPSFAPRKYLRILERHTQSGLSTEFIRFNNDSSANYARRSGVNNGADTTLVSATSWDMYSDANQYRQATFDITNNLSDYKLGQWHITVTGSVTPTAAPNRVEGAGFWANTSQQITRVDYFTTTNALAAGAELIVLGHN